MAKLGEGDPRWIVSNRDDGKNVNAWHWEEKDLSKSSHEALKELFKGAVVTEQEGDVTNFKFTELSEIDGDITVAQRKGKIMCYFEVKMTAKWEATVNGSKVEGKIAAPDVEHDNFGEDFDLKVSTVERSAEALKAEAVAQKVGRKAFRSITKKFFDDLFTQYAVGTKVGGVLPAGVSAGSPATTTKAASSSAAASSSPSAPAAPKIASNESTSFTWVLDWNAPVEELFRTFTDSGRASAYTRSPAKIDPQAQGTFEYLGGAISGFFNEVTENKKITMQWRLGSWPANTHSSVVMEFVTEEHGRTRLNFAQAGIPAGEVERVKQGWSVNFFEPIKMMMGYSFNWVQH